MKRTLPDFLAALVSKITPFKNLSALVVVLLLMSGGAWGQVTITNPNNTTPAMSATYGSLALAIADVNNRTAISGPITITLDASTPQTAPAGGYSITAIPTGASSTNKIIFDGGGNTITAPTPQTSGNSNDAIFKIIGADFITIQNFTMQENAANTTTAAGTNNMTEFGVALFYATATNGAQNNTIQNNTISLNRTYLNTFGIYSNTRTTALAMGTAAETGATSAGANSGNKIYTNIISNVNYGIVFIGSSIAAAMDNGNDIGGSSSSTGNTISNCGGGASSSSYLSLTGSNYIVFLNHQINSNFSYNSITTASLAQSVTTGGILQNFSTTSPTSGTFSNSINNNTITVTNNPTLTTAGGIVCINTQGLTPLLSTATLNLNNNIVTATLGGSTSTTNGITGITNLSLPGTLNITGNTVLNCAVTATTATSGALTGISSSGAAGTVNINANIIRGLASTAASGQIAGLVNSGAVVTALNINNNSLGNATSGFFTTSTATSGSLFGISTSAGASTCALSIQNNDFRGITYNVLASAAQTYITNTAATLSQNISSNTFTNLNVNTTGSVTFISNNVALPTGGSLIASSNSIVTGFNKAGAGGTVTLYLTNNTPSSVTTTTKTEQNNNFSNITLTGATTMAGWMDIEGTAAGLTKTINGNTFSNWSCGSGNVNVLQVGYCLGSSSISTNTISTITTTGSIIGISLLSNNVVIAGVSSNSITGLSSTGTGGSVTGISNSGGTASINSNTINNLSSTSTTATVAGITTSVTANIFQNTINTLSCVGTTSGVTNGIMVTGGTTINIYRNKIYDLATTGAFTTSPGVNGIVLSAGTTVNIYNNLLGDLKATTATSTDAIRGISITSTTASTSYNVYNNTVYLSGSGGANFGTSGIYHSANSTASTAKLDLQNNMIFNTCTPSGTGIVTAFRRSAAATLGNYATSSNKNLFYAGTPSASTTIMSDGTNNYQTVTTFQTAVSNRDANSFTESTFDPATYFVSTTGSNANYLQPVSGLNTQAEGGGNTITMCSPDYNGVTRPGFSGAAYDVGAWEFAGVSPAPVLTNITPSPALTTQCTKAARVITIDITTASGTITGATLNYNHNGTAQTAVTMTNSSGNTWTGTMLAPSTGNATVTWSITATNSLGLNTLFSGTSYADEPNTGITATATATPSTVCDGSNSSLNINIIKSGTGIIGSGSVSSSSSPTPFSGTYGGMKGQYIILASELISAGYSSGNLTGLGINFASSVTATYTDLTIQIGNTSLSAFNSTLNLESGLTTVYGPTSLVNPVAGVNAFTLTTPFNWDGVSNIIISTSWSNNTTTSTSASVITTTTSSNLAQVHKRDSFTPSSLLLLTGTQSLGSSTVGTARPNFTIIGNKLQTASAYSWSNGTTTLGTTNPLSTPITSGLTYTATATVNGCPMTAAVTPTVNSLPTAPTATNSSQCGAGIPTASVADNNSYTTPTFKWYSAASGGTALQTSTSTTYTTSINATTTFYVAVVGTNTCESARTAVTVTVTQPDAISSNTSAAAICLGQSVTLTAANAASTPTQNYTYSWICATTGSGATIANTNNPASITPTAAGSYTYTVTGTDGACSAVNTVAVTVNALPNITSATSTPNPVCSGAAITLTGASVPASAGIATVGSGTTFGTGTTGTFLRQGNTVGNQFKTQYLFLAAELQAAGLSAGNITGLTFDVYAAGGGTASNLTFKLGNTNLTNLTTTYATGLTQVYTVSTYPASGSVQTGLQSVTFNTPFNWDGSSNIILEACSQLATIGTDGTLRSTTTSFTSTIANSPSTTACSSTTGGGTFNERPNFRFNGQVGTNLTSTLNWSWNSTTAITTATGSTTETNTGASAITKTYTVTATNATSGCSNSATTSAITINPAPVAPTATNSTQCGSGTPTCSVTGTGTVGNTFKWYTVSTGGTALVGQSGSTLSSYPIAANTTFYVSESNGTCESARTQVDVTVTTPPAITASASLSTVCSGSPTVLSVSSANSGYTYAWSNSLGSGASVSASPTSNTTYTVTATDSSGGANNGCVTTATVAITSNDLPSAITFSTANANICTGSTQSIVASGGTNTTAIFNENFEVSANSFTAQNASTAVVNSTYYSQGASSVLFNTSATTATKKLTLNSNIDLTNCSSATLTFSHIAAMEGSSTTYDYGFIEYSIDGGTSWVVFPSTSYVGSASNSLFSGTDVRFSTKSYIDWTSTLTSNTATPTNSLWKTEQFNIPLSALTNQFKFRFSYYVDSGTFYYGWLIDNISINKNITNITWSPTTDLYTDAATSTAYTGNPTTVYAKPTTNTTYTATATNAAGCSSSNTVTVTVSPTSVAGSVSANQAICTGNSPSDITLSGNTGNIQWQVSTNNSTFTAISGATAATLTSAQMGTLTATRYYRAVVTSGVCTAANSSVVTVTVNSLPTTPVLTGSSACSGSTGSITSSTSETGVNYQLYDSSNATVGTSVSGTGSALSWSSIAIGNGYYAKATNATTNCISTNSNAVNVGTITTKTWTANSGNWSDQNNWSCGTPPSSSDVIVISSGSPVLDTNFTVGAGGSLTLSGTGTLTINSASTLTIAGTADFGGKAVTIKSNATGNGAIGQVTGTLSGATNVTVERYIPAKRSWRALTAPLTMATSINANWQEGGTANTTNGFDIWDPNGGTGIITGGVGSSLLEYSSSANTWSGITNTTAASSMMTGSVNKPFMAFVTGPYGSNNIATGAAVTTLKATGTLLTGDKTYATTANKYAFIGNPYASPLNLTAMLNNTSNATASFGGNVWVWDANVLGTYSVGTYNLFDFAASNYSNTSNNANISGAQIQSGQAFFVKSTDGASFTIKEAHKGSVFTNAVFRSGTPEILRVNLFKQVNNEWAGRDGAMEVIFSDAAADQAPNKMANGSENIAFTKNGALFASEHHLPLVATDVFKVKVWNTIAGANYKLKINTEQFTSTNLNATLEDLFTNSRTPLTLDGSLVEYPFTVTTDALSSGDRFRIVFQNAVLGTNNPTANGFSIVPNPVTGDSFQVNLGTLATGNYSYSICNAIGQEVEKGSIQNATQNTNYTVKFKENAATGIYIMKIKGTDNSVFTAKIIKK